MSDPTPHIHKDTLRDVISLGEAEPRAIPTPALCLTALKDACRRLHGGVGDTGARHRRRSQPGAYRR